MITKQIGSERKKRTLSSQTFITVDSIAGYCMVSRSTVGRWIRDGKLSAMKLPSGHFRVSVKDFKNFLAKHDMPIAEELAEL